VTYDRDPGAGRWCAPWNDWHLENGRGLTPPNASLLSRSLAPQSQLAPARVGECDRGFRAVSFPRHGEIWGPARSPQPATGTRSGRHMQNGTVVCLRPGLRVWCCPTTSFGRAGMATALLFRVGGVLPGADWLFLAHSRFGPKLNIVLREAGNRLVAWKCRSS